MSEDPHPRLPGAGGQGVSPTAAAPADSSAGQQPQQQVPATGGQGPATGDQEPGPTAPAPWQLQEPDTSGQGVGHTAPAGVSADPQPQLQFPPFVSSQPPVEQRPRPMYGAVLRPRPGESVEEQAEGQVEEPAPGVCAAAA